MPKLVWKNDPMAVVQGYESRHPGSSQAITPLVLWATWTVEGLHYLDDIDRAHQGTRAPVYGHHPDIVDIANVRWATGTAITALDLCAAALGRVNLQNPGQYQMDLRNFVPNGKNLATRQALSPPALRWIDNVLADQRYIDIHGARNPFTHSWLNRTISVGAPPGPSSRTGFVIRATGQTLNARALVEMARDLATDQINDFLAVFAQI
jgi:hypothetical protein